MMVMVMLSVTVMVGMVVIEKANDGDPNLNSHHQHHSGVNE